MDFEKQLYSNLYSIDLLDNTTILSYLGTGGGLAGGKNVVVEPHRHPGVFIVRGKEQALLTRNLVPGDAVYGEKRISVDGVRASILFLPFPQRSQILIFPALFFASTKESEIAWSAYATAVAVFQCTCGM